MKLPVLGDTIAYMRSPVDWARDRYGPVSTVPIPSVEPPRSALSGGWTAGQVDQ